MQTLPKDSFQLSHRAREGLGHQLLKFEDIARPNKGEKIWGTLIQQQVIT